MSVIDGADRVADPRRVRHGGDRVGRHVEHALLQLASLDWRRDSKGRVSHYGYRSAPTFSRLQLCELDASAFLP